MHKVMGDQNDYLRLTYQDFGAIVQALNSEGDLLRLSFGAKCFRKILTLDNEKDNLK